MSGNQKQSAKQKSRRSGGKKPTKKPKTSSKGRVRWTAEGEFQWYDAANDFWVPAVYHNDYRENFLAEDAPKYNFVWEPQRGWAEFDETSHMEAQRPWSGDYLERIVDSNGRKVLYDSDLPKPPKPANPGNWIIDNKIVLDGDNNPVRKWGNLNKTLSSEIEDWRLEAIRRLYPWITTTDIIARMPHFRQKSEGGEFVALQSSRAFTNRTMRFRQPKAIIPINKRKGTKEIVESFKEYMDKHKAKSAEGVPELTAFDLRQAKKYNKGKFDMNSRYHNGAGRAELRSSKSKRKADDEEFVTSKEDTDDRRAKRVKREPRSISSSPQFFAAMPTPHDRTARIRDLPQSGQPGSEGLSDPELAAWIPFRDEEEDETILIPLFVSLDCEHLAAIQDSRYTTPQLVIEAKARGCRMLDEVEVRWYREDIEKEIDEDGIEHPYVVMRENWELGQKALCANGSVGPGNNEGTAVPRLATALEIAQRRLDEQVTAVATTSSSPTRSIPQYYNLWEDDEEAKRYDRSFLQHGPYGM